MKHTIIIKDLEDIDRAAGQFLSEIGENKLIAFYAPMGAGKTTFTTAIARRITSSPWERNICGSAASSGLCHDIVLQGLAAAAA